MPTDVPNYFNLAFGDVEEDGTIDDYSISDNGDRNKILATIAFIVDAYLNRYPGRLIYFKGSTQERTRLYRMAVGLNLDELLLKYEIFAEQKDGFIPFQKDVAVLGILVKKKIV